MAYRAVSQDLVLLDAKTNLVVDFLTNVIPRSHGQPMRMTRRVFLVGLVLFLASTQRADDFKFPLKSNSVRFAAIGDMGTGEKPSMKPRRKWRSSTKHFPSNS